MYRDPFILFALSITAHVDLIYIHLANNYCYGYFLHDHIIICIPTIAPSKSYDAYYIEYCRKTYEYQNYANYNVLSLTVYK